MEPPAGVESGMIREKSFSESHTNGLYGFRTFAQLSNNIRGLDGPMPLVRSGHMFVEGTVLYANYNLRFLQTLHLYLGNHDAELLDAYHDSLGLTDMIGDLD